METELEMLVRNVIEEFIECGEVGAWIKIRGGQKKKSKKCQT